MAEFVIRLNVLAALYLVFVCSAKVDMHCNSTFGQNYFLRRLVEVNDILWAFDNIFFTLY